MQQPSEEVQQPPDSRMENSEVQSRNESKVSDQIRKETVSEFGKENADQQLYESMEGNPLDRISPDEQSVPDDGEVSIDQAPSDLVTVQS